MPSARSLRRHRIHQVPDAVSGENDARSDAPVAAERFHGRVAKPDGAKEDQRGQRRQAHRQISLPTAQIEYEQQENQETLDGRAHRQRDFGRSGQAAQHDDTPGIRRSQRERRAKEN